MPAVPGNMVDNGDFLCFGQRPGAIIAEAEDLFIAMILKTSEVGYYTPGSGEHGPRFLTGGPGAAPGGVASKNGWVYMRRWSVKGWS